MKAEMFANEGTAVMNMTPATARKRVPGHGHCSRDLRFIFGVCLLHSWWWECFRGWCA